jgi:hypothetical protein
LGRCDKSLISTILEQKSCYITFFKENQWLNNNGNSVSEGAVWPCVAKRYNFLLVLLCWLSAVDSSSFPEATPSFMSLAHKPITARLSQIAECRMHTTTQPLLLWKWIKKGNPTFMMGNGWEIWICTFVLCHMMMMTDEAFAHGELKFVRANVMWICGYANYIGNM